MANKEWLKGLEESHLHETHLKELLLGFDLRLQIFSAHLACTQPTGSSSDALE